MSILKKGWIFYNNDFEFQKKLSITEAPWGGHIFFAYDLVRNLRPNTIVELGTFKGYSLFSFAQAGKDAKLSTKIHAIDTWEGDKHAGFWGKELFDTYNKIRKQYYEDVNIITHRTLFDEAVKEFKENSIDILHIDGLHTYEAVKNDFDTWLPKVKKDTGVIMFHDVCETKNDFGVYKLWEELKRKYKNTLTFRHSHGLGVIFLSKETYELSVKSNPEFFVKEYELKGIKQYYRAYTHDLLKQLNEYNYNLNICISQREKLKKEIEDYDYNLKICISQRDKLREEKEDLGKKILKLQKK